MKIQALWAHPDFLDPLKQEIARNQVTVLAENKNVFVVSSPSESKFSWIWAQNLWDDCDFLEFKSISDAAKLLKDINHFWISQSDLFFRRAALIEAAFPRSKGLKKEWTLPWSFLEHRRVDSLDKRKEGLFLLLSESRLLVSRHIRSFASNGEINFNENRKNPPSRAYLKLWEFFTRKGVCPRSGDRVVELGASPGGWTWVLDEIGCQVKAFDRSALADSLMKKSNIEFVKADALKLEPTQVGAVDWLFSDLIADAETLKNLVLKWEKADIKKGLVLTIKFKGPVDWLVLEELSKISKSEMRHLWHNKNEVTWSLIR